MQVKAVFTDEKAVSPVIGVILMVAITVILAAVIGTFVLGIGQDQQTTPNGSFDFEYDSSVPQLTVTHSGGDNFNTENSNSVKIAVTGITVGSGADWLASESDSEISAGDSYLVCNSGTSGCSSPGADLDSDFSGGETVRIVWTAPSGDKTQTVGSFDIPN